MVFTADLNGSYNGGGGGHGGHQLRRPLPSTSSDRNDENEDSLATNDLRHKLKHRNNAGGGNQRQGNIESGLQKLSLGKCSNLQSYSKVDIGSTLL